MAVPPELSADYTETERILKAAFKDGEYHCSKPRCGFKSPNSLTFIEHIAGHVNEFCKRHGLPLVKAIAIDGTGQPINMGKG